MDNHFSSRVKSLMAVALFSGIFSACNFPDLSLDLDPQLQDPYLGDVPEGKRLPYTERFRDDGNGCVNYNPLRSAYFGDTHVHTARSLDASTQDTRTTPYQAYEFAKGESIGIQPWKNDIAARSAQLGRALDFAMVSDHAELFGETSICNDPSLYPEGYDNRRCKNLRKDPAGAFINWNLFYLGAQEPKDGGLNRFAFCGKDGKNCTLAAIPVWQEIQEAADAAYDKSSDCRFTSFIGYEHSGSPGGGENLHRNVLFRNANVPAEALSFMEYSKPENLWKNLQAQCTSDIGCDVLTIAHNSNMSNGRYFRRNKNKRPDQDFDKEYASLRNKYEPLMEIYQHKGDSECIGSADELCGFEKFPYNNLIADRFDGRLTAPAKENSFTRYALKEGLALEKSLGINPFKYGFIGSTDTHLGTPGLVSETNYPGHGGAGGGNTSNGLTDSIGFSSGGLAVVWAEENSRDYLFDAMQRKETYATSGPRMLLRLFGGWDMPSNMCETVNYDGSGTALSQGSFVSTGYANGVPMGADLPVRTATAPKFAVAALKDPGFKADDPNHPLHEAGYDLQRLQIVKGWVDNAGKQHEKVYDVAGNANNGASVDLNSCSVQGSGEKSLCNVWQDPDFDPSEQAFYYARVVENPSCRWSWQQCSDHLTTTNFNSFEQACSKKRQLDEGYQNCCLHEHLSSVYPANIDEREMGTYPATVQERAWSSPIWYQPE